MDQLNDLFFNTGFGAAPLSAESLGLILLLAFALGHVAAWVYMWTHSELSYSRTFVLSLAVLPVVVSLLMVMMQGDIVVAFGLLAVFAVVRFRNVLKDTRDTVFVLWVMVIGMGVGTRRFGPAVIGCLFIAFVLLYLRASWFGGRMRHDTLLSVRWKGDSGDSALGNVLRRFCSRVDLSRQHADTDGVTDLSYRLLLRDPSRSEELLGALRELPGIGTASLYRREEDAEF